MASAPIVKPMKTRPKKKNDSLRIRMCEEEAISIKMAAVRRRMTISAFVRMAVFDFIGIGKAHD